MMRYFFSVRPGLVILKRNILCLLADEWITLPLLNGPMVTRGLVDSLDRCQVLYRFFQAEKGLMSVADTCGEMFHLEPEMVNR